MSGQKSVAQFEPSEGAVVQVWDLVEMSTNCFKTDQGDVTDSEASTIQNADDLTRSASSKGKGVLGQRKPESGLGQRSLRRKVKSSRQLVQKICQNHLGATSNNSVLLRSDADQRRGSVQGLVRHHPLSSDGYSSDSSTATDSSSKGSDAADDSTRKTSLDSRFTLVPADHPKRRNSRRHPWTRSSPEGGALGTIEEAAMDSTRPSILTVERTAAAKVYIETAFHEKMNKPDARDTRRQLLESQLYFSPH